MTELQSLRRTTIGRMREVFISIKNVYHDYRLKQGGQTIQLPRGVAITVRMRNHG